MSKYGDSYTTPFKAFLLYMSVAFVAICAFRCLFPNLPVNISNTVDVLKDPPHLWILDNFQFKWRLTGGIITFIHLFPVLAFSALVLPFGLKEHTESGYAGTTFVGKKGFSTVFLKYLTWPIITACTAGVLYALLFFLALPFTINTRVSMETESELFIQAKKQAEVKLAERQYTEALHFIKLCERIWRDSEAIDQLKSDINNARLAKYSNIQKEQKDEGPIPIWSGLPGNPVTSAEALRLAQEAYNKERYYDANWLALLTQRLAKPGAAEIATAASIAALSWEKITELEPNAKEKERFSLYRLKRDGFEAMVADNWISAYYIFNQLSYLTPDDPDVANYLGKCKAGVSKIAFFIDEMDLAIGKTLAGTVFSMPGPLSLQGEGPKATSPGEISGRIALRFDTLAAFPDYAYAWGCEAVAADEDGNFRFRFAAGYAKLLPISSRDSGGNPVEKTALLLHALDRDNQEKQLKAVWTNAETAPAAAPDIDEGFNQIILNISYTDFLLLSGIKQGTDMLNLWQLFAVEKKFGDYGYIPQIFRAEILRRLGDALFFLPMAVLAMVLGWRYRAPKKPRYAFAPMLGILPLVFFGAVFFYRTVLNNLAIQLSLSIAFPLALAALCAVAAVFFTLSLVLLSAQHG
jgi:hypothetical protein